MFLDLPLLSQLGSIKEEDTPGAAGPSCELKPEKQTHLKLNLLRTLAKVTLATTSLTLLQHFCAITFKCSAALYSLYEFVHRPQLLHFL